MESQLIIGRAGSGKTYTANAIAEEARAAGATVIAASYGDLAVVKALPFIIQDRSAILEDNPDVRLRPLVVILDSFDKLLGGKDTDALVAMVEEVALRGQRLQISVVMTVQRTDYLPQALLRRITQRELDAA